MEVIGDYLSIKNVLIYFLIINLIGFTSMFIDKKKAQSGVWRTPEKTLLLIAVFGGSIGSLIGMYVFRHKTKKARFTVGVPMILIIQIVVVGYLFFKV